MRTSSAYEYCIVPVRDIVSYGPPAVPYLVVRQVVADIHQQLVAAQEGQQPAVVRPTGQSEQQQRQHLRHPNSVCISCVRNGD